MIINFFEEFPDEIKAWVRRVVLQIVRYYNSTQRQSEDTLDVEKFFKHYLETSTFQKSSTFPSPINGRRNAFFLLWQDASCSHPTLTHSLIPGTTLFAGDEPHKLVLDIAEHCLRANTSAHFIAVIHVVYHRNRQSYNHNIDVHLHTDEYYHEVLRHNPDLARKLTNRGTLINGVPLRIPQRQTNSI